MVHINGKPQTWSNTRVFRSSVLPHDQDPENANGGQAILRLSLKDWNVCFWLNLLAVVFDGQLSFVEHVTGMVLSCRPRLSHQPVARQPAHRRPDRHAQQRAPAAIRLPRRNAS